MKKVVLDIETKNTFADVGKREPAALDISLLGIYNYDTDSYQSFTEKEFVDLWKILEQTEMIIGFNSNYFDIPLLNKYYAGDLTKIRSLDLLEEIERMLGRRVSLDAVAQATLGINKSGYGLQAVEWWRKGEIEKVRRYCLEDVRITKEIYEFALKNRFIKYEFWGEIRQIPLDSRGWEEKGAEGQINYTLPI